MPSNEQRRRVESDVLEARPYTEKWWKHEGVLGSTFATQAALKSRIRGIVDRAQLNTPLQESDAAFLIDVLRRHHHWTEKQGSGVRSVVVRLNPPPGFGAATRGLWLIRADASEIDISWVTPLRRDGASNVKNDVALAARREVSGQTRAIYERMRGTPCPLCGKPLLQGHVDHIAPLTFDRLLSDWLGVERLTPQDVKVADGGVENSFVDRELAARWSRYHLEKAKLRVIHPGENLSMARRDRQ